jgi:CelD/BcsL family acetyltransferase involved in cellulose biosynthesis
LHRATLARTTFATRQSFSQTDRRWQIALSQTFDDYLASRSSSTRKGIRRTAYRLEQELGGRLAIRIFREPAELDRFFRDADAIAARTYQRGLGVGFDGSPRQRARTEMLMEHGWFRGYVLYVDGRPAAFEQGELYGGRFLSLSAGYDPDYGHQRVGAHLLAKAIEDLAADPDVLVFDFGFGDAEYKGRLADRCIEEGDVVVYARRPRPLAVNFSRAAVLGVVSAARTGLGRAALLDRARKWRRRRAEGTQSVAQAGLEGNSADPAPSCRSAPKAAELDLDLD